MVTDAQVGLLRQKLMEKKTQEAAAASAGMSVRSARKWQSGPLPSERKKARSWRTRADPFGREGAVDFTHCEELGVTVGGRPFPHLLFEFVLSFSKWPVGGHPRAAPDRRRSD